MPTWTNEDGLLVRFPLDNGATVRTDGVKASDTERLVMHITDATALGDTDTAAPVADEAFLPAGTIIKSALFVVDTAFTSGGSAVLDIGLKQAAGTNIDDDGIDAAIAVGSLTANAGIESDGALIGTKLANDSYVMFTYDTAAFTAGAGRLFIEYMKG